MFFIKSCKSTSNQSKIKLFWSFSKNCDVSVVSRSVVSALCWDWDETRKGEYENFNYIKNWELNLVLKYLIYSIPFYSIHITIYPIYFIPCFLFCTLALLSHVSRIPEKLYCKVDAYLNKRREREARLAASLNMEPNRWRPVLFRCASISEYHV